MKQLGLVFALFICALLTPNVYAIEPIYQVSVEILEGGELHATPSAVVLAGSEVSVAEQGDGWYTLHYSVSPTTTDSVGVTMRYESATGTLAPTIEVEIGKTATMKVGDVQFSVTVEPVNV